MKTQPLDDLEMFELLQACYPEKFPDDEDETFDAALNFASELSGFDELADLLGRVAMLTMPTKSGLTERLSQAGRCTAYTERGHAGGGVRLGDELAGSLRRERTDECRHMRGRRRSRR